MKVLGEGIEGVASAAECELNVALRTNGITLTLALALALTLNPNPNPNLLKAFEGAPSTVLLPLVQV